VYEDYFFIPSSVKEIKDSVLHFYNNDPEITHDSCPIIPCNVLLNGLLYKCPLLSSYSEAKKQFKFEESAQELLEKYCPGNPYDSIDKIESFLKNLKKSVLQCSLCNYGNIEATKNSVIKLFPRKSKIKLG
jgi:hypothetical protein